ncbi:MAG: hypothetical protein CMJ48_05890 [Planctomycetaceae bacterium]|nr:hypothetical protein [Planctomycetaceae bacterium]
MALWSCQCSQRSERVVPNPDGHLWSFPAAGGNSPVLAARGDEHIVSPPSFLSRRHRRRDKKGYIRAKLDGRTRVYAPKVKPRTVIRETLDDLIDRLFGGEVYPLMKHLIEDHGITGENIDQLKQLLEQLEEESDGLRQ